jgi:hypothetical protein
MPGGDVWEPDRAWGGWGVRAVHGGDVLWDERAECAERAVQCDVLLRWGRGGCDADGWGDRGGLSVWALLSCGERDAVGVRARDVQFAQWEWECFGLCGVRRWAVLCDGWAECADGGVSSGQVVCDRDGCAECAVSAWVLVSCGGGAAAGLCERDVPGPGWAGGVQGVSGWVVL